MSTSRGKAALQGAKSVDDLSRTLLQLLPPTALAGEAPRYVEVDGPVDPEETLITYDVPIAPHDPKRSLKMRKSLGLPPVEDRADAVDPNVRIILDSFIVPHRWVDPQTNVVWEQHASPYPTSRTDALKTSQRYHAKLREYGAKRTGTCPVRTLLVAECYLELMRQVVAECWERGLLLLHIHAERVAAQAAHRELFESRVGHALRLALKGEKDTVNVEADIARLKDRVAELEAEESTLRTLCDDFTRYAEEQVLIQTKAHNDAVTALKKEGLIKKNQLEAMLVVPTPQ